VTRICAFHGKGAISFAAADSLGYFMSARNRSLQEYLDRADAAKTCGGWESCPGGDQQIHRGQEKNDISWFFLLHIRKKRGFFPHFGSVSKKCFAVTFTVFLGPMTVNGRIEGRKHGSTNLHERRRCRRADGH
jgi:hypothetical protein